MTSDLPSDLAKDEPAPPLPERRGEAFRARVGELASAIEQRPAIEIETVPEPPRRQHRYWAVALLAVLTIAVSIGVLLSAPPAEIPGAPAAVTTALAQHPCGEAMTSIMSAIALYTAEHGAPPAELAALHPQYLAFPPVDPATREPYGYDVIGASVSLACPRQPRQAAAADAGPDA